MIPKADTTLSEMYKSAEQANAEILSLTYSGGTCRTFTLTIAFGEGAKYLNQCVSDYHDEEFELDGSDY
jgi:hypothetical protein